MLICAAACWGTGTVITKQALGEVPPLTLLPLQLLISALVLLGVAKALGTGLFWSPSLRRMAMLGVLNPGLAYTLGLLGLAHTSASMAVLLWALEPAFIYALAHFVLQERTTPRVRLAISMALGGVLLVVYHPGPRGSTLGVFLVLAAVAACAAYTVIARQLFATDESLAVVIVQQLAALGFAVAVLVIVEGVRGGQLVLSGYDLTTWAAAIASGALYYGLAFWFYIAGLRNASASVAGSFIALIPVFGLAAGAAYGETLTSQQWIGAVIVVGAVAAVVAQAQTETAAREV
jgi:probable blue pigment (indigoidine) exporter